MFKNIDLNALCFRIFSVLFLAIIGAVLIILYAPRLVIPFALSILPTATTEARYTDDFVWMSGTLTSPKKFYRSKITYNGQTATLISSTPPTRLFDPQAVREAAAGMTFRNLTRDGSLENVPAPDPVFEVRYVRAFPSMVVLSLPHPSLESHLAQFWTPGEFGNFLFYSLLFALVMFFFVRHLRRYRGRRPRR